VAGLGETSKVTYGSNNAGSREWLCGVNIPSITQSLCSLDAALKVYEDNVTVASSSFSKGIVSLSAQLSSRDRRHTLEVMTAFRDEIPKPITHQNLPLPTSLLQQKFGSSFLESNFLSSAPKRTHRPVSPAPTASGASIPTLHSLEPSTKLSLAYSFIAIDSRDSASNPSRGNLASARIELALPPGSARFVRLEGALEKHTSLSAKGSVLPGPVVLSLCSSIASTLPLRDSAINISDRYFLGGGLSLRGWQQAGIGPRSCDTSSPDALGGNFKWNALAALSGPFPVQFPTSESFKTFAFVNCGSVLNSTTRAISLEAFLDSVRVSAGCGVSYAFGPARLEVSYALPIRHTEHDVLKPFQIGIGLSMNGTN
jgi:outer membrane protein assembly factor BamA